VSAVEMFAASRAGSNWPPTVRVAVDTDTLAAQKHTRNIFSEE